MWGRGPAQRKQIKKIKKNKKKSPVLRIRIRDQGSGAFLTPGFGIWDTGSGSGMGKKSGSRSRIRDGKPGSYF